jgi:hypothetical protein
VPTELQGLSLTALHQNMMLAGFFPDFELVDDGDRLVSSHEFKPLDGLFLEPERASIMDMLEADATISATRPEGLEPTDPQKLFSAAELRNDIRYLRTAYAEFDLDNTAFGPMAAMVTNMSNLARDDYHIEVKPYRFEKLAAAAGIDADARAALVHSGGDYVANTNVYAPLIALNGSYFTTVTLLSRFMYYWKTKCLNRNHRFRVRSGFIFEHVVKAALLNQGFEVTGIKRINRKEFDVVAVKDAVIFNLQCKNNLVDLTQVERATDTFVRYNRALNRYYDKALKKEEKREDLLKAELGLTEIHHMVISRFTIATTNRRVLPFARIGELEAAVQSAYGDGSTSVSG